MTSNSKKAVSLYRSLLKAHSKYLPPEMKSLGDAYVQSEFRLHKSVTNQDQLSRFFAEWNMYLEQIQQTARARETLAVGITEDVNRSTNVGSGSRSSSNTATSDAFSFGKDLDEGVELTDEQKLQLEKLREETSNLRK
jgi:Complex 1 protein (LYR family).